MIIPGLEAHFHGIDLSKTITLNEVTTILNIDNFLGTILIGAS